MTLADEQDRKSNSGVSRRSIVRTAGTAAWAAPVIVAATAAPAAATVSGGPALSVSNITGTRGATTGTAPLQSAPISIDFTVNNTGAAATTTFAVTLTITPKAGSGGNFAASTANSPAVVPTASGTTGRTFSFTTSNAAQQVGANSSRSFNFQGTLRPVPSAGDISITATPVVPAGTTDGAHAGSFN